jgi:hypothetical protein
MSDRACVTRKLAMDVGEKLVLVDRGGQKGSCTTPPRGHVRNRLIRPFLGNCRSTDVALLNSSSIITAPSADADV